MNKLVLFLLLLAVAIPARKITEQNFVHRDPSKVMAMKDNDTLYRCNLSQDDTLTPICSSIKGLVVYECNYFNCLFPNGTKIIGGAGCQKVICRNDSTYVGFNPKHVCTKNCTHVTSSTVVIVDGKLVDTIRVYASPVLVGKSPIAAQQVEP